MKPLEVVMFFLFFAGVLFGVLFLASNNVDGRSRCEEKGHELRVPTKYLHGKCFAHQQGRWKEL